MATKTARFEMINPYSKYGLKRRPTFEEIVGLISDDQKALKPLPNREATRFRNSPQGSFFDGADSMELLKEQQNRILDRQMRENILRRNSQNSGQTYHLQRHMGNENSSSSSGSSSSVVEEFGIALNTARAQGSGMDAETSMREQAELRRQEQVSQGFGQRLQERAQTLMSSFLRPKPEVHSISSDEEFVDSQGQEIFARQSQTPQSPPSLPAPPHSEEINYTGNMYFWNSQPVDYIKYQLFLRNISFQEEDKITGNYKNYLLKLVQNEIHEGEWSDPVSDEIYEKRRREWAFRNRNKSKTQSLSSSLAEGAREGAKAVAKAAVVKGGEMLVKKAFGV